ncbi:MAG: hypothetical protein NTX33_18110 [Propionibacteriales bacterium]|nr:hypothetical protein [Propionibacteriales bacterium]
MTPDSRAPAVVRAWALGVAFLAALALGGLALLVGDVVVDLPGVRDIVFVLHMVPGLAAIALAFPLVDRTPDLTLLSATHPARLFALRFAGLVVVATPVAVCVGVAGWTAAGAGVVLGFVGVAGLFSAILGLWYWGPMLVGLYGWIRWPDCDAAAHAGPWWLLPWLGLLGLCGAAYVVISSRRVQRVVRAAGTSSESGRDADTIRP